MNHTMNHYNNLYIFKEMVMKHIWTSEEESFLRKYYPTNGPKFCVQSLNLPPRKIYNKGRRLGLVFGEKLSAYLASHPKPFESFAVNPRPFLYPETPEIAYLLGLLWADGYILLPGRIILECVQKDMVHFKPLFDATGNWCYSERIRAGRQPQASIYTNNGVLAQHLNSKGYYPRSACNYEQILDTIPKELHSFFFLGLMDGDGNWYFHEERGLRQASISASINQDWSSVESILTDLGISYSISRSFPHHKSQSSGIRVIGKRNITILGNYLYPNPIAVELALPRKYEKWKVIVQ